MASDYFGCFDSSFYSDPFFPFTDSTHHDNILQSLQDCINGETSIQENSADLVTNSLDQISSGLLPSSPPSNQLQNLSLTQLATPQNFLNATATATNAISSNFSVHEGVKTEEFHIPFGSGNGNFNNPFCDNAIRSMQRSYSSSSFNGKQPNFCFQPCFESVLESPNLHPQPTLSNSHENKFASYQMRRVSSTGDLQRMKAIETRNVISTSPLSGEGSFLDELNFKVGRYTAEERKERIHKYRIKRHQRNFNKTIKYACRKTLADNRPRIRGRFARNDEAVEIPKATMFNRYEEEEGDDLWVDRCSYHQEEETVRRGLFYNSYGTSAGSLQQYYSY